MSEGCHCSEEEPLQVHFSDILDVVKIQEGMQLSKVVKKMLLDPNSTTHKEYISATCQKELNTTVKY